MNDQLHPDPLETERYLGSRVLLGAGAVALILGATFFFKLAFDNGWIGPTGRVALGLIAGSSIMLWSDRIRASLNHLFSESMTAIGACLLYLSLWAAGNGFHIVPIAASFAGMAVITGTLIILALRRNSEITAILGLTGGFLTPALTSTGAPAWANLLLYLAILSGALVFVPRKRSWHFLTPPAFVFTQLYFTGAVSAYQTHQAGAPTVLMLVGFATVYFAIFSWRPVLKTIGHESLALTDVLLVLGSAIAYYATLHSTLYSDHRLVLTGAIVTLAFAYVALAYLERSTRTLFATMALALCTGSVAVAFDGEAITAIWAIEGALLVWAGASMRLPIARLFALIAFACSIGHLAIAFPQSGAMLLNERFITMIAMGLSFGAAGIAGVRYADRFTEYERPLLMASDAIGHLCSIAALSDQFWIWSNANELSLTLVWALYGAVLLVWGFATKSQFRRVEALVLLMIAVLKAFVVDLNAVDPAIRIVSFLALGAVLLGGSYWYFRSRPQAEGDR